MGAIDSFFNKTATIKRKSSGTGVESELDIYAPVGTCEGCLRPVTVQAELYDQSNFGYEFRFYCGKNVDILVDDILTIDTFDYLVKAVNFFEDEEDGEESHKRVTVVKTNTNDDPEN